MKKFFLSFILITFAEVFSQPMIPLIPANPVEKEEVSENGETQIRKLIKTATLDIPLKAEVIVPLEIITDVDIKALIIDDENLEIPFELELNRKPEAIGLYRLNFSSTQLDIDDDGVVDTEIFASKNISDKFIKDNYIKITGKNISREGTHKKRVYITVEVNN